MTDSESHDRRKYKRLKARKEVVLITPNGIHKLFDISAGGFSFTSAPTEKFPTQWPVELIFAGASVYMKDIPVRLVREEISEDCTYDDAGMMKKVGVEFMELDMHNQVLLEKLLAFHTEGQA